MKKSHGYKTELIAKVMKKWPDLAARGVEERIKKDFPKEKFGKQTIKSTFYKLRADAKKTTGNKKTARDIDGAHAKNVAALCDDNNLSKAKWHVQVVPSVTAFSSASHCQNPSINGDAEETLGVDQLQSLIASCNRVGGIQKVIALLNTLRS